MRAGVPLGLLSCVACVACGDVPTRTGVFPVTFTVSNRLVAPVMIAIDGVPSLGLPGGASSSLTVPSSAQWLTWTSAKPMDGSGNPIADDIPEVRVAVGGIGRGLDIRNVIEDQTYVTAELFNHTDAAVWIGVWNGTATACAAFLPAKTPTVPGYTRIGYYRLLPTTEIRAHRDANCTGPHLSWRYQALASPIVGSGLIALVLESAP